MNNNIMPNRLIAIMKKCFTLFCVGLLAANLASTSCWGADESASAPATITLDVKNEPLRSVLGKITKATRWKIKAPDKWLDKPVTQTLSKATLEDGLKSLFNNAGVENLFIMYDEYFKVVTIYDTESTPRPAAGNSSVQLPNHPSIPPPTITAPNEPGPRLQPSGGYPAPVPRRAARRPRTLSSDDE
jgi:hypothetical protein